MLSMLRFRSLLRKIKPWYFFFTSNIATIVFCIGKLIFISTCSNSKNSKIYKKWQKQLQQNNYFWLKEWKIINSSTKELEHKPWKNIKILMQRRTVTCSKWSGSITKSKSCWEQDYYRNICLKTTTVVCGNCMRKMGMGLTSVIKVYYTAQKNEVFH